MPTYHPQKGEHPMTLLERLQQYRDSDICAMHMPGHKRLSPLMPELYGIDITEIDGFDNLHDARGILKDAQERAARLFGADRTWFLVNGSTCGLLAGIFAATKPGDTVLVARNCHKAVYHALALRGLKPIYLYPKRTDGGYAGATSPEEVREALAQTGANACIITSPTYEGVVSDIHAMANACHERGAVLIVDEAHGAHLPLLQDPAGVTEQSGEAKQSDGLEQRDKVEQSEVHFPSSALSLGADVVVQSVHKTLPAPTQTALLHVMGERVAMETVEQYLAVFETSSPSYPLMAGIDLCMEWLETEGEAAAEAYRKCLGAFYEEARELRNLQVLSAEGRDPGKVLLSAKCRMTGRQIYDILRNRFGVQPEMATEDYCLLMTSICDGEEQFRRVLDALRTMDDEPTDAFEKDELPDEAEPTADRQAGEGELDDAFPHAVAVCPMMEALTAPRRRVPIASLTGDEVSAEWVGAYPPGIPLIAPGERVKEVLSRLNREVRVGNIGEELWVSCIS